MVKYIKNITHAGILCLPNSQSVCLALAEIPGRIFDWPRERDQSTDTISRQLDWSQHQFTQSGSMASSLYLLLTLVGFNQLYAVSGRIHASLIPEDPHAFPKYDVTFLNGLPVLNETAERWLQDGLQGGLLEFLEEPWVTDNSPWSKLKGIDPTEVQYFLQRSMLIN